MTTYATPEMLRARSGLLEEQKSRLIRSAAAESPEGSTFLSHSSRDVAVLADVIKLLEDHGARVYIDKGDADLPTTTSRETAQVLRTRIVQSRKFILLASGNSKDSRWMPWELGIADGLKRNANTAVFPIFTATTDMKWAEQEYLGIYDRIVFGEFRNRTGKVWMVHNRDTNKATELREWLQRSSS